MSAWRARSISYLVLFAALALISVVCLAQKSGESATPASAGQYRRQLKNADFIDAGSLIFTRTCSSAYCHGAGGMGGGAPRLRGRDLDPAYMFRVISNGAPGTPMAGFKGDLSEEQRWKLVAFILSPVVTGESGARAAAGSGSAGIPSLQAGSSGGSSMPAGDPATGKDLFYDLANQKSCHGCHAIQDIGGKVGPDLGAFASDKSDSEVLSAIVTPRTVTDPKYATVTITMADGDIIVGVKKEDRGDVVRVYDTTVLPAVLRTLARAEIVKMEPSQQSVMPRNYGSVYTGKELADIVAFIKSAPGKTDR